MEEEEDDILEDGTNLAGLWDIIKIDHHIMLTFTLHDEESKTSTFWLPWIWVCHVLRVVMCWEQKDPGHSLA
jgi:hypothetical protein